MAQDSSSPSQNNQEIDLDDIDVEIMIIAKNPKLLAQASAFLTRRGWPTTAISNLAQAIELAAEKKPDFVLVSLNHQNPSMGKFIDLVKTTFNSTIVAFIENMDTASNQRLNKSSHQYKIFGQMSGPNLHRSIRRILAEKLNIGQEDKSSAEDRKTSRDQGSENISIKGGGAADGRTMVQKNDKGATQDSGAVMIKNERTQEHAASEGESQEVLSAGKYKMGRAQRRSLKDLTADHSKEAADPSVSPSGKQSKDLAAKMKESLFGKTGKDANADMDSAESESNSNSIDNAVQAVERAADLPGPPEKAKAEQEKSNRPKLSDLTQKAEKRERAPMGESAGPLDRASAKVSNEKDSKNPESTPSSESVDKKNSKPAATAILKSRDGSNPAQSMIEKAVQSALERICQPGGGNLEIVEGIENVGVFPVDSPSMPGYLVLAWPNAEKRAEEAFFNLAQETLKTVFQEMGVQARLEQGFFVEIPRVDFAQWTNEAAFNLSLNHRDRELGVAFFSTKQPLPKAQPVEGNAMFSIGVDHISTERPVTFKAYLHLKKNNKYFLYLRNGRNLQPEQQQRLKEHKVKDFYMKSVDIENLRSFLAASYLTKTIKRSNGGSSNAA